MKQCFIIAGANGEIGRGFVEKILPKHTVIAISKQHASQIRHPNLVAIVVDLTKPEEVEKAFSGFDPTQYDQITFIHSIGIDKFENKQFPKIEPLETIDPVVYASNVNTYKYLARFLIKKIEAARKIKLVTLKFVMIGSIADKYGLLVMTSFTESKNIIRSSIRDAIATRSWISGLIINISSTITTSAMKVRPYADTTYWLTPKDIVDGSLLRVLSNEVGYQEIDLFKHDPMFHETFYTDDQIVFDRWKKYVHGAR